MVVLELALSGKREVNCLRGGFDHYSCEKVVDQVPILHFEGLANSQGRDCTQTYMDIHIIYVYIHDIYINIYILYIYIHIHIIYIIHIM